MKCTVCGYTFTVEQATKGCSSCPFIKGCKLVRCPNCFFETPVESSTMCTLKEVYIGEVGKIVSICTTNQDHLKKIISLGLMPGMQIKLLRKSPAFLCEIGFSKVALDEELAALIIITKT